MKKITFFDIETYKHYFCMCAITQDMDTMQEVSRVCVDSGTSGQVGSIQVNQIIDTFRDSDYIVSFNGSRFDIPVLAKIKADVKRMGTTTSKYINADAENIIGYDTNNHPVVRNLYTDKEWTAKHFDMLTNCLLKYSLKQWELYCGIPVKELPYNPGEELTPEMMEEIKQYCFHDVWATSVLYWKYASGKTKSKFYSLPCRVELIKEHYPENLLMRLDRTPQALSAAIIYRTTAPIPPKSLYALELFKLDDFDVPQEVKDFIRKIDAQRVPLTGKAKSEFDASVCYKGIQFGKGGCHFIRKGKFEKVYCFDVQSEYPRIVRHWHLLKTPQALDKWSEIMEQRFAMKALKGTPEYRPDFDLGLKLVLNSLSGGFRIRSGGSVAFDPAVGEAMCYIGQLLITELALACPDFDSVVEINTDSVFVVGEENARVLREKCKQMKEKYDMLFEEEVIEKAYFRDVNNYAMYDADGNLLDGRGQEFSYLSYKGHETAVNKELFRHLLLDKLDLDFSKYDWHEFVYKYHKSGSCKYAAIGGKLMEHKNYYFLWTTRECPNSQTIQFSNTLLDSKTGSIQPRYGVFAYSVEELEQYKDFIDYKQYNRDLDENFLNWGRTDLITTFLGNAKERRAKGMTPKSLKEALALLYPNTVEVV